MKICGIICEYNPLHSGHLYQMMACKEQSGADTVVCVMSGNFVQRGMPAVADKFFRAKHALFSGADIVFELPAAFSLSSAEDFAYYGVKMLDAMGAESISFGSECGDLATLQQAANRLDSDMVLNQCIKIQSKKGVSYPRAVYDAFSDKIFQSPNNLLGIEYLRAINKLNSKMIAYTVERKNDYNGTDLGGNFISATAARAALSEGNFDKLKGFLPQKMLEEFKVKDYPEEEQLINLLLYVLRTENPEKLVCINGISEGLHNRMVSCAFNSSTLSDLLTLIKTKRYTMTRIRRSLYSILLSVQSETVKEAKKQIPYLRILGVKADRTDILSHLSDKLLITGTEDLKKVTNPAMLELLQIEKRADALYPLFFQREQYRKPQMMNKLLIV